MSVSAKALVLDFGGVISRTLFETHDQSEAALGLPAGSLRWCGPFAPKSDPLWRSMQAGQLSERDYWQTRAREVGQLVGEDWREMADFVRACRGADPAAVIRPEALATIDKALKDNIKLAILSNELDLFYGADFRTRLPFMARFDVIVDATYSNILKPDIRAYQQVAAELSLSPEACVFVDDQPRNVAGARSAGMIGLKFDVMNPGRSFSLALDHFEMEKTSHA